MNDTLLVGGLSVVLALVLFLPFSVRWIEEELEVFLLTMGALAVTIGGLWSVPLVEETLREPIKIAAAVLIFGFLFRWGRDAIGRNVSHAVAAMGLRTFAFVLVVGLGLLASVITAIIAALVLVEVLSALRLDKSKERTLAVTACYAIGLGAVLTPLGEPLSTIATAKLAGPPHQADFFFLARLLGFWVLPGLLALGAFAARVRAGDVPEAESLSQKGKESIMSVALRAGKVYAFVAALVLLGRGFTPLVDRYLVKMPGALLYWVNMVSAVLDNATLAAAEISPKMSAGRITFLLVGLLVSGGMLIPGNIPNIICANKLGIKSRDWARIAVPLGLVLMVIYFLFLLVIVKGA